MLLQHYAYLKKKAVRSIAAASKCQGLGQCFLSEDQSASSLIFLEMFPYKKRKIADDGCVMPGLCPLSKI
jgi:hypothetical protein